MARYWHLLRRIKSPSRRWVLSTVVDILLAIEIVDDAIRILVRNLRDARSGLFCRGAWLSLLRKLEQLPFALRLVFIDTLVVSLMVQILPAGHALHFGKIVAIWVGAFSLAYSIEAASPPLSRIRMRHAHWVGSNGSGDKRQ